MHLLVRGGDNIHAYVWFKGYNFDLLCGSRVKLSSVMQGDWGGGGPSQGWMPQPMATE